MKNTYCIIIRMIISLSISLLALSKIPIDFIEMEFSKFSYFRRLTRVINKRT
jgi:hypothetical protein